MMWFKNLILFTVCSTGQESAAVQTDLVLHWALPKWTTSVAI